MPLPLSSSQWRRAALTLALLLSLAAPAKTQVELGSITGAIVDAAGQPVPGLAVVLRDQDGATGRTDSDAAGRFQLSLPGGIYDLHLGVADTASAGGLRLVPGG